VLVTNPAFWAGQRVLLTGHTGFKGAWLALWLRGMGADVFGFSLPPATSPSLHALLGCWPGLGGCPGVLADINDRAALASAFAAHRPGVVLHLAAQALVRPSYAAPVETFATNVLGTVALLDAVRACPQTRAVVIVTSDKAYENREWAWPYREEDALGGHDPYSASKACAEIATAAMRRSFFGPGAGPGGGPGGGPVAGPGRHPARIATARAGNVIGGGDWSPERLVPDIVRGLGAGEVVLRNPGAVRPWQHVLEPLAAYLLLAEKLAAGPGFEEAWNIGPDPADSRPVREVAAAMLAALGQGRVVEAPEPGAPHEAHLLTLDSARARAGLGWRPRWGFADAIGRTAAWYAAWAAGADMAAFTRAQIADFQAAA